jgi:hypothetical protein
LELSSVGFTILPSNIWAADPALGKKVAWVSSLVLLFFTGVVGVYNGVSEWGEAHTPAEHSVTVGVLLYGILGLVTALGLIQRRRWSVGTAIAWAVPVTYVPGVAVMVYGDEGAIMSSAIAASAGSALIALAVVWTAHVMTRGAITDTGSENRQWH